MTELIRRLGGGFGPRAAAVLMCAACASCQPPEEDTHFQGFKLGMGEAERVAHAENFGGRYSVHEYEFWRREKQHTEEEARKLTCREGPNVSVELHIEWPDEAVGVPKEKLSAVRKDLLEMVFSSEYSVGSDEFDANRFLDKAAGLFTDKSLAAVLAEIKARAHACGVCKPAEESYHRCSQWSFTGKQHLDWPFGREARADGAWYARPVLCVWNDGYSNDGGNGCHCFHDARVYSLTDGRALGVDDYFAPDKLEALTAYVWKRLAAKTGVATKDESQTPPPELDLRSCPAVSMLVTKEGMRWTFAAYSFFAGIYCVPSVTISWRDLEPYRQRARPAPLLVAGSGRAALVAPDGATVWEAKDCGNIHRVWPRGDWVYYSNADLWRVNRTTGARERIYHPCEKDGLFGFEVLPDGNIVVAENGTCYITELEAETWRPVVRFKGDPRGDDGKVPPLHGRYRMIRKTAAGTYLVCCSGANRVREYDAAGNLLWEQATPRLPSGHAPLAFDAVRRANGNTIISHLGGVSEFTPGHETVWSVTCADFPALKLDNLCGLQELPNGNLVIGTYANGRPDGSRVTAFEITRDKQVVWTFASREDRNMMTAFLLPR